MLINISEPIKKEKNFIGKITNEFNKKIRIKVPDVLFMSLAPLSSGGRTMRIYINDAEIAKTISDIDDNARELTIKNNQEWFNNNLDNETIDRLFRNSMNKLNNTMVVLISDTNEPTIYVNGIPDDEYNLNNIKAKTQITLSIEAQGLLIYPKKFGIRWLVRNIYISNDVTEDSMDTEYIDKETIEDSWKLDINEMEEKIDEDILVLESRINELKNLKIQINNYYNKAIKENTINKEWHETLKLITKKYSAYFSGSV
jgi:hypothetical protein